MISAPFCTPSSQSWPSGLMSFSMTSPQILHLYLADPAFRQVAAVLVPSTSTYSCSWASALKCAVSTTPPASAFWGIVKPMVALL